MANMSLTKTPIAEQEPKVRARNFKEVTLHNFRKRVQYIMPEKWQCTNP